MNPLIDINVVYALNSVGVKILIIEGRCYSTSFWEPATPTMLKHHVEGKDITSIVSSSSQIAAAKPDVTLVNSVAGQILDLPIKVIEWHHSIPYTFYGQKLMEFVKIPEGGVRRAVKQGLKPEFLAYFRLKSVNQQGYFTKRSGIREVSASLGISQRTVRRWFDKLIDAGWMYKDINGYGLISYDRMYELLGYNMSHNKRKNRLGTFKIYKIKVSEINVISITREEIRLNQGRQAHIIKRKSTQNQSTDKYVGTINRGVSLSCLGVGRLLGYKKSSGFNLEKGLKRLYPNTVHIEQCVEYLGEVSRQKTRGHYVERGILFKVAPNRIIIH